MAETNIYDYVLSKTDVTKVLDHYNTSYNIKNDKAWLCCPFHHEKEPSFSFDTSRKIYRCWGCKLKGNPFTFIKEFELLVNGNEIEYYDAMVICAKICNIKINLSKKEQMELEMESLDDISDIMENDVAQPKVQEVFLETAIKKFYNKTNNYMVNKGYKKEILDYLEMGFYTGDKKDYMNNRCVFPVRNINGELIGWTGRSILKDAQVKWFHAPPNRFYKSLNLYNIDKAINHILECGSVNVVESVGNVARMLESGRYNTVATLGSTISFEQCEMLLSFGVDIVFWYDWDNGGFEGINLALDYITNYDIVSIAVTDYGLNENGRAKDIGDASVSEIDDTNIISVYEYIAFMKRRFVGCMEAEFEKDNKIKLTDGTVVLCTNKLNPKLETRQLLPSDIMFIKSIDALFKVNELSAYEV